MPVLPFYLAEIFNSEKGTIGIILSCYTIAALCIRPFSGYLLDTFARKPLYLLAYFLFTAAFGGYLLAGTLTLFTLIRIFHGLAFGTVTVAGNTVVIDIMPSSRRGEGLGYYGMMNNTAMSIGPMVGLFLHNAYSFEVIFWCALVSCALGLVMASLVKTPVKEPVKREPISLDRFILLKGIPAGICLLLLSVPYGMTSNYIAMYSQQIGITAETGFFFTLLAFLAVMFYLDILKYILAPDYWIGLRVVPIVMAAEIFMGIFFNLSFWYKLIDETKWGAYFSFAGCIVLILINVIFVPLYSYMACAWAGFAGYAVAMLLSYFVGQKKYPIHYDLKAIGKYVALALVLFGISEYLPFQNIFLLLSVRTVLLMLFVAYIIKVDFPLHQIPVINRFIKK